MDNVVIYSIIICIIIILILFLCYINREKFTNNVSKKNNFRKPDFICIGVQKGGTCALISYLNYNKDIYMVGGEIHFFDKKYDKGLKWYESKFKSNKKIVGEKTPFYIYDKKSIDRIYYHYPDIKLIIFFREPISRAYSQYNMNLSRGESRSFKEYILNDLVKKDTEEVKETDILQRGYYDLQLSHIYSKFPKKNVFIGFSHDFKNDPNNYNKIYKFLGAEEKDLSDVQFSDSKMHIRKYINGEISREDEILLYDLYKDHIENFYKIIGKRIDSWDEYHNKIKNYK